MERRGQRERRRVSMHHVSLVHERRCLAEQEDEIHGPPELERSLTLQERLEVFVIEVLRHEVGRAGSAWATLGEHWRAHL